MIERITVALTREEASALLEYLYGLPRGDAIVEVASDKLRLALGTAISK